MMTAAQPAHMAHNGSIGIFLAGAAVNDSQHAATAGGYSALVRGPSASFPRGGVWMFSFWYAVIYLAWFLEDRHPPWFDPVVLAAFAGADITVVIVFTRATNRAFTADRGGIWLGKKTATKNPQRLVWEQIRQLTISSYPHGSMLQVVLDSNARATSRLRQLASLALMSLPLGIRRTTPGLLTLLPDPPRYRVPLARVTSEELKSALSGLAPATLPIEILP